MASLQQPPFLPMTGRELAALGWDALDVLLITGDAYVDHPAFGVALLGRWLIAHGFRTGIIAQPPWQAWQDIQSLLAMGTPRLLVGVTAGALDSQLAHYTAFRKKRHDDAYTAGGKAGARPNRACLVYANLAKRAFPNTPLLLGGIEASLRRISHYDFWTDTLRRSLLVDAKADVLIYGMGERALVDAAQRCAQGLPLTHIAGSAWMSSMGMSNIPQHMPCIHLPSHERILTQASLLMEATQKLEQHVHQANSYAVQPLTEDAQRAVILAPPAAPLSMEEMNSLYALPFQRKAHPLYTDAIPAEEMLRASITSHRGCGGGCSFCSLALHQGRHICSRSENSIIQEVQALSRMPGFSGSISDVGGPTANMWQARCAMKTKQPHICQRSSCCYPHVCKSFIAPQKRYVSLLRRIAMLPRIKHVRIASGLRPELAQGDVESIRAFTQEFTGGQLKLAPEHCVHDVLRRMRKPDINVFQGFLAAFVANSRKAGREHYIIPYFMSSFPGCTDAHMHDLAHWLRVRNWKPQQVQCFIPTPGTVATAMFYTGLDEDGQEIPVARSDADRIRQHRILMPSFGRPRAC